MHGTTRHYPTGTAHGVRFLAAQTQQQPQQQQPDFPSVVAELVRLSGLPYEEAAALTAKLCPDLYAAHRTRTGHGSR